MYVSPVHIKKKEHLGDVNHGEQDVAFYRGVKHYEQVEKEHKYVESYVFFLTCFYSYRQYYQWKR